MHVPKNLESFKLKLRSLSNTNDVVLLIQKKNLWRTFEMFLINCEINVTQTWSGNCVIFEGNREATFTMADIKLYKPLIPLSTQDNTKLQQKLKSGFKRKINWNKYQ